jgi:L-alanine-DL-glutamate epimerase-like enolase superfamily enzyme
MKIAELEAFHVKIPLKRSIRHASHRRTETDNVVVRCVLDDGTTGYGEGVPRDYVTGETVDSALTLLAGAGLKDRLEPSAEVAQAAAAIERLTLNAGDERGIAGNAARCAVELAFLDACGRRGGWPLSRLTEVLAPECHQPSERVRYSGVITSAKGMKLRAAALVQGMYGFAQMKVKVGIEGHDDVKRLRLVRAWAGRKIDLRIDANEAWKPADAVRRIKELEPFGITCVEQPVAHEDAACLAEVRKQTATPVMLDESLCGPADAERAIREKLCDVFNLRLSKCGGFVASLRLAQTAKRAGLLCQLGCQVGETAILSAAGRHFASSVGGLRYVEGSYDGWLVREALATTNLTFGLGGWAPALKGGGLGIEIDTKALQLVTVRRVPL